VQARSGLPTLIVFAKQPVPGRVKTRLARTLGERAAAELGEAFLRDTLRHCAAVRGARRVLCFEPASALDWFAALDPGASCSAQCEGDLGARLEEAFERAFAEGAPAVVALGSDAPHLHSACYEDALARAAPGRVVLGPSADGGYTLIGLAAPTPGLFADIPWSTPGVLAATVQRSRALGLEVELLAEGFDVDEAADLRRLRGLIEAGGADCPATAAALRMRPML
jgi:uncharacterized protein